jgi:hypothetical protein
MQMVKIRFTNPAKEAEGFVALAKWVHVVCFDDDTYEIAKPNLKILDELDISYEVLSEVRIQMFRRRILCATIQR